MYAMGISVPQFIGPIFFNTFPDQATLELTFGLMGLTAAQQNQILSALTNSQTMYVLSGVSIADAEAELLGIELHDGEQPNEANQILFTQVSNTGGKLLVNITVNDQIVPAPVQGTFHWHKVKDCLVNSGVFTSAQADAFKTAVETTGSATGNWTGISTKIVDCLGA
jgi:hypothetical protein